jgi:L-ascorbate metabolism protein UlaG (beta-lactamase superfamily)
MFLRRDVVAEPLFNRWYAWSYLIPPHTAAMFVAQAHLRMMRSFGSAPRVHAAALQNPKLRGGPFLNYDESRVPEVSALADHMTKSCAELVALSAALCQLDELVARHESGTSLELLYPQIPAPLRGFVELTFDAHHRASFRVFEGLLYRSHFYNPQHQSIALSCEPADERSFVFSTPRLAEPGKLFVSKPFADPAWDAVFHARRVASSVGELAERLDLTDVSARGIFEGLFTDQAPAPADSSVPSDLRIRYFGHACVLLETAEVSILVDPLVSYDSPAGLPRFGFADLPQRIDFVLLTHAHQDHVLLEVLLQLRARIGSIVVPRSAGGTLLDPSLKLALQQLGFSRVTELGELESIALPEVSIIGLPFLGEHCDLDVRTKLAYAVKLAGRCIVFAADSNNIDPTLYEHIAREICPVDLLFLGMECDGAVMSWLYGPLFARPVPRRIDETRRSNGSDCERGMRLVDSLRPERVAVYAMGQEPWCTFLTSIHYVEASKPIVESDRLVAACRERGILADRLFGRVEWSL